MSKKYYVYYDNKSRDILSVTNEQNSAYEFGIVVDFEDIENFLTGKWHFKDFKVDYESGSSDLKVIPNSARGFNFDSNEFRLITETDEEAEFVVEWNALKESWVFELDNNYRTRVNGVFNSRLMFFVTLESDHDFLIRTIYIDADDLKRKGKIEVPFIDKIEQTISKISISSRMNFKNYKLKVVNED